jgi:hypothetical protein
MKHLVGIIISFVIGCSAAASADTYRNEGLYEVTLSQEWQILSKARIVQKMEEVSALAKEAKLTPAVDPKDLATPFIARKSEGDSSFELRVITGPADPTRVNLESMTSADIQTLKELQTTNLKATTEASKLKFISFDIAKEKFKALPALRTETLMQAPSGEKVLSLSYVIYQPSATLILGMIQSVAKGEPSRESADAKLTTFNVLAK